MAAAEDGRTPLNHRAPRRFRWIAMQRPRRRKGMKARCAPPGAANWRLTKFGRFIIRRRKLPRKIMPPKATEKNASESKSSEASKIAATRQRDLEAAISDITKNYGEGSSLRLGDEHARVRVDV